MKPVASGGGRYALSLILPRNLAGFVKEALSWCRFKRRTSSSRGYGCGFRPGWPGILLHEAVSHGLEGDFNGKNTSAFSNLMKRVAAKGVTVFDDGNP